MVRLEDARHRENVEIAECMYGTDCETENMFRGLADGRLETGIRVLRETPVGVIKIVLISFGLLTVRF